jgi:hypothetical protein
VFHQLRIPIVAEAAGELADDVRPLFHLPQQQTPSIAGDGSAVELPADFSLI